MAVKLGKESKLNLVAHSPKDVSSSYDAKGAHLVIR